MNTRIISLAGAGWLLAAVFPAIPADAQPASTVTNLITFDDLPDLTAISNGYGQLDWSGLQTITAIGGGYSAGVISHPNSAYNPYGYDATISDRAPFNLVSAYLTSAAPTMSVEVLGSVGTNLLYDQTFDLNDTNATLVAFNYSGVTQVTFRGTIGQPFVMDNLTVSSAAFTNTTPPPPPTLPTNAVAAVTNVLGFDDLPDMSPVPVGYAGLNWSGFDVLSELDPWFGSGYENGLVSPPNVVFNPFGGNAGISAGTPFNLASAYLTAGVTGMQLEVVGYAGDYLAYDQTYALSETTPTLITFDFLGVTDVEFIPEPMTQFVMDNLTVSGNDLPQLPPPSAGSPPTNANSMVNLGTVVASSIGHEFFSPVNLPGMPPPVPVTVFDFLVDQTQTTGGGAVLPSVEVDFDTNNQFELTIAAPPGEQFAVHVPPGQAVSLVGDLRWDAFGGGSSSDGTTTISFAGLSGTAPDLGSLTAVLSPQHSFFGYNNLYSEPFTNDFSFTSMTLTGTVPSLNLGLGSLAYAPETDSRLGFSYATTATSDPGPFVSLEAAPSLDISAALLGVGITLQPNGDVTLTFAGTLQSSTNLSRGFSDVPAYPRGQYTIPKSQLKAIEHFRVRQ